MPEGNCRAGRSVSEGMFESPSLYAAREAVFGMIIAANLAMLFAATGTFPGVVVKNSYSMTTWKGIGPGVSSTRRMCRRSEAAG